MVRRGNTPFLALVAPDAMEDVQYDWYFIPLDDIIKSVEQGAAGILPYTIELWVNGQNDSVCIANSGKMEKECCERFNIPNCNATNFKWVKELPVGLWFIKKRKENF